MKNLVFLLLFILFANNNLAMSATPEATMSAMSKITPYVVNMDPPIFFSNTNNLRRKTGSPFLAKGEHLVIDGYVTDIFGTPIENAVIKIWHTNHFGYYNHLIDPDDDSGIYDQDFIGSGKAITNNLGYFSFITIEPGYYKDHAPHVNFIIEHDIFGKLETRMFFQDHPMNKKDKVYKKLQNHQRSLLACRLNYLNEEDVSAGKRTTFNIRMDGIHPLKRY